MASPSAATSPSAIDLGLGDRPPSLNRSPSSRLTSSVADDSSSDSSVSPRQPQEAEAAVSSAGSRSSTGSSVRSPVRKTISTPSLYTDDEYLGGDGKQTEKYRSHPQLSVSRRKNMPISAKNKLPAIHDTPAKEGEALSGGRQSSHSSEDLKLPGIPSRPPTVTGRETRSTSSGRQSNGRHSGPRNTPRSLYERYGEVATIAEEELRHNWILAEEDVQRRKLFQLREARVLMSLAKEDPLDDIEHRMEELSMMAKPRRDERPALERISEAQKLLILKYHEMPYHKLKKTRRKGWKTLDLLRWAARMVALLVQCTRNRRQYYTEKNAPAGARQRMQSQMDSSEAPQPRSSLTSELLLAVSTQPQYRDAKCIKKLMYLLGAVKSFKHLFAADMETEVARYLAYEKYEDGRILAHQGRPAERFYYVLGGQVQQMRQYRLSTGHTTQVTGTLGKGKTTNHEELERQTPREEYLVAKGNVEVLLLDKKAFDHLSNTVAGPPVDFLRGLDVFQEFPVTELYTHPDAIEYKYYGQGRILSQDTNRTPWLHIVKSGSVQIVRAQSLVDARQSNQSKFTSPRIDSLGYGRSSSSHADAMLGVQAKQRKWKSRNSLPKPPVPTRLIDTANPLGSTIGINVIPSSLPTPEVPEDGLDAAKAGADALAAMASSGFLKVPSVREAETPSGVSIISASSALTLRATASKLTEKMKRISNLPSILNIPIREETEDLKPHKLWLTREMTEDSVAQVMSQRPKLKPHRDAFVQLGLLTPGDVFGLDHLQPAMASEPPGVSLLSAGAEVIKISKRFFLQNAGNNTMLKVETMGNEYISEDDAKASLYNKETWSQYKDALWDRVTARYLPALVQR